MTWCPLRRKAPSFSLSSLFDDWTVTIPVRGGIDAQYGSLPVVRILVGSARIHDVRARVIASCLNSTDSRSGQLSPSVAETASQPMNAASGVMLRRFDDAHGPRRLPLCCLNAPPSTMTLAVPSATAWSTDRPPTRMVMSLRVDR